LMATATEEEMRRLTKAFLPMKKLDIHLIEAAINDQYLPEPIVVTTDIPSDIKTVWSCWTEPHHISGWCFASDDWHVPNATNDLRPGGTFVTRMEAKDGSVGFDFSGIYDFVDHHRYIEYSMSDGRKVFIRFLVKEDFVRVIETFDGESENSREMQQAGWQSILEQFKKYVIENT